jgi:hypothetical protein
LSLIYAQLRALTWLDEVILLQVVLMDIYCVMVSHSVSKKTFSSSYDPLNINAGGVCDEIFEDLFPLSERKT